MAYAKFIKKSMEILIYDDRSQGGYSYSLGDLLFSFLELDLNEYNELYNLLTHEISFCDYKMLLDRYPKTAAARLDYDIPVKEDLDNLNLREYCEIFLLDNKDAFSSIYEHPYFYCSDLCGFGLEDTLFSDLNFYKYQQLIIELIDYCFLDHKNPKINELSLQERYFLFSMGQHERWIYSIKLNIAPLFIPFNLYNNTEYWDSSKPHKFDLENPNEDILNQIKNKAHAVMVNKCESIPDFLYFEFNCLYSNNIKIKRCKNCGKYFILKGDYSTDYCDRIPGGKKLTCKKLGAIKNRKNKVKNNPILKEYEKAYKRMYARLVNHKISNEDFRLWVDQASIKRDQAVKEYEATHSDELLANFKKYLCNR